MPINLGGYNPHMASGLWARTWARPTLTMHLQIVHWSSRSLIEAALQSINRFVNIYILIYYTLSLPSTLRNLKVNPQKTWVRVKYIQICQSNFNQQGPRLLTIRFFVKFVCHSACFNRGSEPLSSCRIWPNRHVFLSRRCDVEVLLLIRWNDWRCRWKNLAKQRKDCGCIVTSYHKVNQLANKPFGLRRQKWIMVANDPLMGAGALRFPWFHTHAISWANLKTTKKTTAGWTTSRLAKMNLSTRILEWFRLWKGTLKTRINKG